MYTLAAVDRHWFGDVKRGWEVRAVESGLCKAWTFSGGATRLATFPSDPGHPVLERLATPSATAGWPELAAYRGERVRPSLLWVRSDVYAAVTAGAETPAGPSAPA
jgi:hypothetical protein